MNTVTNYVSIHHAMQITLGSAIVCASVAVETGIRGVYDVFKLMSLEAENLKEKEQIKYNISANLGSALFYGLCAANIIPGTAILGAVIFTIYSNCVTNSNKSLHDEYLTSKVIGWPCQFLMKKIIIPVIQNVILLVVSKVATITFDILKKIPIPTHPVWVGSALLITAIAITKFALPAVGITLL